MSSSICRLRSSSASISLPRSPRMRSFSASLAALAASSARMRSSTFWLCATRSCSSPASISISLILASSRMMRNCRTYSRASTCFCALRWASTESSSWMRSTMASTWAFSARYSFWARRASSFFSSICSSSTRCAAICCSRRWSARCSSLATTSRRLASMIWSKLLSRSFSRSARTLCSSSCSLRTMFISAARSFSASHRSSSLSSRIFWISSLSRRVAFFWFSKWVVMSSSSYAAFSLISLSLCVLYSDSSLSASCALSLISLSLRLISDFCARLNWSSRTLFLSQYWLISPMRISSSRRCISRASWALKRLWE
mmetsp:Transcript_43910/g.139923  ORF Transcript_43910/g.139923 Transcript_43910/m.139923 type:complete len:315 (+) Transcript_43910:588-1532(+)